MYAVLLAIYVAICLFLIATILLQAGRGGGLDETFGGAAESLLGTKASTLLKRMTEVGAVLFLVLSLVIAVMTSRQNKSLFDKVKVPLSPVVPYDKATTGETATAPATAPDTANTETGETVQ